MTESPAPPPPPALQPPVPPVPDPGVAPPPNVPARGLTNRSVFIIWFFVSGIVALPFAWYSTRITRAAKLAWSGATAVQVTALIVYIVAILGNGGVSAPAVASKIQQQLPGTLQQQLASNGISDATVSNASVSCSTSGSNQYTCNATYTVTAPNENLNGQGYQLAINAQVDASGTMTWKAPGAATPTG